MKKNSSFNDSLFSMEYKIPYSKESIESHLEQSQEEINFIKYKLTEAYQKLQYEIQSNNSLEEENEQLKLKMIEYEEKYQYEKKQNSKLKETLEVILKNRKLMQEEHEEVKDTHTKKIKEKDRVIEQLHKEVNLLSSKCQGLTSEVNEKSALIKELEEKLRQQSMEKDIQNQRQYAYANKIQILEQQISKLTQEKYIEVNRLRHQLQLYQKSSTPYIVENIIEEERPQRKRQFTSYGSKNQVRQVQTFNSKNSVETEFEFNKQNVNSLQVDHFDESSINKWKRLNNKQQANKFQSEPMTTILTDDQQLTQYQITRKKAEHQLTALQKIKRPSPEQRQKMSRLQRQIYHLDSDIAGLKRKIRRKY